MVRYTDSTNEVSAANLHGFFVGWPQPPSPETHLQILQNATHVVLAIEDDTDQVVGFINAISDHILAAYIPLLEVLPDYQGRGIGSKLVRRMLKQLGDLYMIDIVCDPDLEKFYARFDFRSYHAMMRRDFDHQSGVRKDHS